MFQLLKSPRFDFMKRAPAMLVASTVVVALAIGILLTNGLNKGIEFTGGIEMQVKFVERPSVADVRASLANAGIENAVVTTIGDPTENEIYIRIGTTADEGDAADLMPRVTATLRGGAGSTDKVDLNFADRSTIERLLLAAPEADPSAARDAARAIMESRRTVAIFGSFDELRGLVGVSPGMVDYLESNAELGTIALRSQSFIGPSIGQELMKKALLAIGGSLVGMLLYIWVRFQLQWGFAAVMALAHDTFITLGLFSIFNQELSLPVVAAFLTLVGYSVNDTVVVFDRIRENIAARPAMPFAETINLSINQTLSRTIITSGLTWIVVFGLYAFGGAALKPFAFVLTVGVVVGTYSSIYIASPLLLIWRRYMVDRDGATDARTAVKTARKVRAARPGA